MPSPVLQLTSVYIPSLYLACFEKSGLFFLLSDLLPIMYTGHVPLLSLTSRSQ